MEIFKIFESTIANSQPGHLDTKDLRRDELLDIYDKSARTLETLIKAKENEISYRRDLVDMLKKSKVIYDNKLEQAKQEFKVAMGKAPDSKETAANKNDPINTSFSSISSSSPISTPSIGASTQFATPSLPSSQRSSDLDIPLPTENVESRSSLDRRLSEFLKTFPNLTQAGLAPPTNDTNIKPMPGYYTQQPPPPQASIAAPAPMIAMMRFPPPNMVSTQTAIPGISPMSQENHDTADMDLSDYEEPTNNGTGSNIIPMVASAMQQGAGGKHNLYGAGQPLVNDPVQYAPRLNALPFDPSIMEPRLRDSPSSAGSRDKHSDRVASQRHSSSSGSSSGGTKHGASKNKYSSSSSSSSHPSDRGSKRR